MNEIEKLEIQINNLTNIIYELAYLNKNEISSNNIKEILKKYTNNKKKENKE